MDTQQTAVFSHDIPTSQPNVPVGWLVGLAIAWTAVAVVLAVGTELVLTQLIENELAARSTACVVAGLASRHPALPTPTLIARIFESAEV